MGLDASIILQGQAPQFQNPLDVAAKVMSMKQMMQQGQMADYQLEKARQADSDDKQMRDIFAKNVVQDPTTGETTVNRKGVLADLYKVSPGKAMDVQQTWLKQDAENSKTERENKKAQLELTLKQVDLAGQLAGAMTDQQSYDQMKAYAAQMGLPNVDKLPAQFDPAFVKRMQMMSLQAKDQLEQQWKALNYGLDVQKFDETKRHNTSTEGISIRGQNMTDQRQRDANAIQQGQKASAIENQLRDEFNSLTKDHRSVTDAYSRVMETAKGGKGVNDIALIFSYMKMLDPGSVVREGEYATARNAGGVPDRIISMYNQALNGSQLSPQVRADMVGQARKIYERSQADMGNIANQYKDIAGRNGANPDNVVVSFNSTSARQSSADAGKTLTEADIQATMKSSGRSRQEVLDAAKAKGYAVK